MMERAKMEEVYEKYSDTVFRAALACLKNKQEAEDVTEEVFIKYFTGEKSFDDPEYEKAWLLRVTINKCRDIFRSFRIKNRVSIEEYQGKCESFEESFVLETLMELPKKYRIAVHLYYYEGYSTDEIGELTGTNGQTIRTRLSRARKMLKESLTNTA